MLIEFKFNNFQSFKDETRFLMTGVKSFKELENDNIIKTNKDFDLLKSAAVYGQNGSGKSNFIYAIACMTWYITESFSESLKKNQDNSIHNYEFKLNTETENSSSTFEVSILIEDIVYRYGFEAKKSEIISEWLFKKNDREILLFNRTGSNFEINKSSFKEGVKFKNNVNQNVLFLSHLSQNNQPISKLIWNWFANVNHINGIDGEYYNNVTAKMLQNNANFKNWITAAVKFLEITSVEAGDKENEIFAFHNKYDENNLLIGSESFNIEQESEGTKKLVQILGPIYDTLKHGKILFIDELDSKLHPNLSIKLLDFFHKFNKNGAQFIFSALDPSLLKKELFRRDQIWFVEKNQFGVSSIFSLSEFNSTAVRSDSAFDRKYLKNEFGAAYTMEITENLVNLLYHV